MVYRLLDNLVIKMFSAWGKKTPRCNACKAVMQKRENPALFLLPVFTDGQYASSKEYYLSQCRPIQQLSQIPAGQRACWFWTLACPKCGKERLLVEDFLRVRYEQVVEKRNLYDMDAEMLEFLSAAVQTGTAEEFVAVQQTSSGRDITLPPE